MEHLIYARWASKLEVSEFINGIKRKNESDYQKSLTYLQSKKDIILSEFQNLYNKYESIFEKNTETRELLFKAYESGNCSCGAKPIFVEKYGFYGCKNFHDGGMHVNFIGYSEEQVIDAISRKTYLNTDKWTTALKHKCAMPKSISLASLYRFVLDNGGFDLCERYMGYSAKFLLNNYRDAIKKGVSFEGEVELIISKKHESVTHHPAIKYQYNGRSQLYAIPDFVAVDDDVITIYECKLRKDLCDDMQRQKYIDLVSFIMTEKKIKKKLSFVYVYKDYSNEIVFEEVNP